MPIKYFLLTPLDSAGALAPPNVKDEAGAAAEGLDDSSATVSGGCSTTIPGAATITGAASSILGGGGLGARAGGLAAPLPKPVPAGVEALDAGAARGAPAEN